MDTPPQYEQMGLPGVPESQPFVPRRVRRLPLVPHIPGPKGYTDPTGHNYPNRVPMTPRDESPAMSMGTAKPLVSGGQGYTERHETWVPTTRITSYQQGVNEQSVQDLARLPDQHINHIAGADAHTYVAGDGEESYELFDGNHRMNAALIKGQLISPVTRDVVFEGPTRPPVVEKQMRTAADIQKQGGDATPLHAPYLMRQQREKYGGVTGPYRLPANKRGSV